jgi:acyl carrier protein
MGATEEDRNRAAMYQAERQRTELSKRGMTTEEFLASLKIEIQFAPASAADLARVAQLTHRTTQFNFTGVLHTEQSLAAYLTEDGAECWTVRVRDVFGDYGLVGALLFKVRAGVLRVEVFLMSCRALGRRVEHEVMDRLKRLAIERGAGQLVIPVRPTTRNRPALEFLSQLGDISADAQEPFECVLPTTGGGAEKRSAEAAASQTPSGSKPAAKLPVLTDEEETMVRIATDLQSAESIIAAIRSNKKSRPAEAGPLAPPRTPMEEALARIWSESLAMAPIGTTDDFFAFGGHSLMATRILARVRTEFGVELSLTDLFKMPTIAGMASEIVERSAVRS